MLPARLLDFQTAAGLAWPSFLRDSDLIWLRLALAEATRFAGRPWCELEQRLSEPLPVAVPAKRLALTVHVMKRLIGHRQAPTADPKRVRDLLFTTAARLQPDRQRCIAEVGSELGLTEEGLFEALFADLPGERLVGDLPPGFSSTELMLQANSAIAQGLIGKAVRVQIKLPANARAVVRHAQRTGLICLAYAADASIVLDLSGPFAIFRRTLVYARALAGLLPHLSACPGFKVEADCVLSGQTVKLELHDSDPMFPAIEKESFDSRLEALFAADFRRVASNWDVHREPEPVRSGDSFVFPDFALVRRGQNRERWLLEILGFWTNDYLRRKLQAYRQASLPNLILCVDEGRRVDSAELPDGAHVVRYRRRIDAKAVLEMIEPAGKVVRS